MSCKQMTLNTTLYYILQMLRYSIEMVSSGHLSVILNFNGSWLMA